MIKPILFNTEMVQAILSGRKTCTRRLVKHDVNAILNSPFRKEHPEVEDKQIIEKLYLPPYQTGDILYVRETWTCFECHCCEGDEHGNCYREPWQSVLDKSYGCYMYRATEEISGDAKWRPSIHMPKAAARIWLKVTDVRVERLQETTEAQAEKEGFIPQGLFSDDDEIKFPASHWFSKFWNFTIKKSDIDRYGWDVNPWVWVIEFERCEKPKEEDE